MLHGLHLVRGQYLEFLLFQDLGKLFGERAVHGRNDPVHVFHNGDLGAETLVHLTQLKPNDPAADHDQVFRDFFELQGFRRGDDSLFVKADKNSYNNPIRYTDSPLLSGYISEENLEQLGGTVPFKTGGLGRGQVVYFTDNTNFRAFWYGTNKLLMNAIFFGDQM